MNSRTTKRFRETLHELPEAVQRQARAAYVLFAQNPQHPSLRYKPIHATRPIFSVRIGADYRAVGVREADAMVWFWIGSHSDYDRLLAGL